MVEVSEYVKQQSKILEELSSIESKDFETKKEYIIRLREVTRPLIKAGYYEGVRLADMARFIQKELLSKHNITYPDNGSYYSIFKDDEKHDNNPNSTRSREKISSSLPIEKKSGDDVIDKLRTAQRSGETFPDNYETLLILETLIDMSNETNKQSESLIRKIGAAHHFINRFDKLRNELAMVSGKEKEKKELYTYYEQCKNTIESIEGGLEEHIKLESLKETLATQKFISKQIDERSKITFLEKWNTIIAEIEIGISAIAKKLGVNKKHLTNNVRPRENPVTKSKNLHHYYIGWFKHIQVVSPSGEEFIFDAKDYFDRQIERGRLNVPFEPMILKNCEVV